MPGHMNVLLAEADVDYEKLMEMDASNEALQKADLAVIVGANDVINPQLSPPHPRPGRAGYLLPLPAGCFFLSLYAP